MAVRAHTVTAGSPTAVFDHAVGFVRVLINGGAGTDAHGTPAGASGGGSLPLPAGRHDGVRPAGGREGPRSPGRARRSGRRSGPAQGAAVRQRGWGRRGGRRVDRARPQPVAPSPRPLLCAGMAAAP